MEPYYRTHIPLRADVDPIMYMKLLLVEAAHFERNFAPTDRHTVYIHKSRQAETQTDRSRHT